MANRGKEEVRRILDIMKRLDFMFPGSLRRVRVRDYAMQIFVDNVHEQGVDYLTDEKLFSGMYIQTRKFLDEYFEVTFHFNLMEISDHLCGHLETRKCWGMTRLEHWIEELRYYLEDTHDAPKTSRLSWWEV